MIFTEDDARTKHCPHCFNGKQENPMQTELGYMYIAFKPCGKAAAMAWDDWETEDEKQQTLSNWKSKNLRVEYVKRFHEDIPPEWICRLGCEDCDKK